MSVKHLPGQLAGLLGYLDATEHPCKFFNALLWTEHVHHGSGTPRFLMFGDFALMMTLGGNLGQMGNAKNLAVITQGSQMCTDDFGGGAANAGVHLVENKTLDRIETCREGF